MAVTIYNTFTRKKEPFQALKKDEVTIYACGPTIYNYVHIGNLRTFIVEDVFVKFLEYLGYRVKYIMNLTDVDDKTIKGAFAEKISLKSFTQKYERAFFKDLETLHFRKADHYPKATDFVQNMVDMIDILLKKGVAYQAQDKSIYFAIDQFDEYGKLSGLQQEDLRQGASERISQDEYSKDSASDFVLWKAYKKEDHDIYWDSPFGKGRPGWHIECSAMSHAYLGETFDIHFGGIDNMFPHHENEIAQSKMAFKGDFANYFLHIAHLKLENHKMSKSLGNIYTLKDLLQKGLHPKLIRYILLSTHYRQELFFSDKLVFQCEKALKRLWDLVNRLRKDSHLHGKISSQSPFSSNIIEEQKNKIENALKNDLNIPQAMGFVFSLVNNLNKNYDSLTPESKNSAMQFFTQIDKIFSFLLPDIKDVDPPLEENIFKEQKDESESKNEELEAPIKTLLEERKLARQNKDFKKSDEIRSELIQLGIKVKDTPEGQTWEKI